MSLELPEALFFVGIDWAAEIHAVCWANAAGCGHEDPTPGQMAEYAVTPEPGMGTMPPCSLTTGRFSDSG